MQLKIYFERLSCLAPQAQPQHGNGSRFQTPARPLAEHGLEMEPEVL